MQIRNLPCLTIETDQVNCWSFFHEVLTSAFLLQDIARHSDATTSLQTKTKMRATLIFSLENKVPEMSLWKRETTCYWHTNIFDYCTTTVSMLRTQSLITVGVTYIKMLSKDRRLKSDYVSAMILYNFWKISFHYEIKKRILLYENYKIKTLKLHCQIFFSTAF